MNLQETLLRAIAFGREQRDTAHTPEAREWAVNTLRALARRLRDERRIAAERANA